ncbi:hypothetical protein B0H14DRAFT_3454092 [Mycena olivaceomarginata]|nr:hypothetical protein B0H14DRAFT_3454092 [Mycena olivaceomarginata]
MGLIAGTAAPASVPSSPSTIIHAVPKRPATKSAHHGLTGISVNTSKRDTKRWDTKKYGRLARALPRPPRHAAVLRPVSSSPDVDRPRAPRPNPAPRRPDPARGPAAQKTRPQPPKNPPQQVANHLPPYRRPPTSPQLKAVVLHFRAQSRPDALDPAPPRTQLARLAD